MVVGQVHRRIDGDELLALGLAAQILRPADQPAFQFAEEAAGAVICGDVRDGAGDEDFNAAFEDVERRGAEFALAAEHFARLEVPPHHGAAVLFQQPLRCPFKDGDLQQFVGLDGLAVSQRRSPLRGGMLGMRPGNRLAFFLLHTHGNPGAILADNSARHKFLRVFAGQTFGRCYWWECSLAQAPARAMRPANCGMAPEWPTTPE